MSLEFYKILHIIGLLSLFVGIGGFLAYGSEQTRRIRMVGVLHGVGWLLVLVSGFGMQAKLGVGFPFWILVKLLILLALGALLVVVKRGVLSPRNAVLVGLALGFVATFLGLTWRYGFSIPAAG